jgi:ABC-type Fe3+-hydroxamate transport system substrate-binding protein
VTASHTTVEPAVRVISLVPSVTETLLAWGVRPVAVTRFCEQPGFPTVGGTKDPDVPAIVGLRPDLVVLDDQENRREDADALAAAGVPCHALHITALAHVTPELDGLARAVGVDAAPCGPPPVPDPPVRLRAWIPIWKRPWMTIGADTYASSLLSALGVANVATDADRYPVLDIEAAAALRPDVVLAPSEPYPFGPRHVTQLSRVAPVVLVDGRDLFWWGVRTRPAMERLGRLLMR